MRKNIPQEVRDIALGLSEGGFKAYLVGGSLRDILMGFEPKDWDIATNATPSEIQALFPESVYENQFGTVGVKTGSDDIKLAIVEVTTFRNEGKYTDRRHPDEVRFAKTIEEDLSRRDLTVNAMALDLSEESDLVDPFEGEKDLSAKLLRTVGSPDDRFKEDALRLMRAVRLSVELGFSFEAGTEASIKKHAKLISDIAIERVRDEFVKICMTKNAAQGILLLEDSCLLGYIIPELREGIGVGQNKHHVYSVFEHNWRALDYAARDGAPLNVRIASLLHDVGKPRTKRGNGLDSTFHGHEVVGARMAIKILDRLKFSRDFADNVAHLVRRHMFYYNVGDVSPAGVRRFLARVGVENLDDLLKVREADRIGSGVKKALPYKLRHLMFMIEKVRHDPVSAKMLAVNGEDVMRLANIPPSRKVGYILAALLDEVLEDPAFNTKGNLEEKIKELSMLSEKELSDLAQKSREKQEAVEGEVEAGMKKKFKVE